MFLMSCSRGSLDYNNPSMIEIAPQGPVLLKNRIHHPDHLVAVKFLCGSSECEQETYHNSGWPFPTVHFSLIFDRTFVYTQDSYPSQEEQHLSHYEAHISARCFE